MPNYNEKELDKLLKSVNGSGYTYYLATTSFVAFVDPKFLDLYVKKGKRGKRRLGYQIEKSPHLFSFIFYFFFLSPSPFSLGKLYVISASTPLDSCNVSAALFNGLYQKEKKKRT